MDTVFPAINSQDDLLVAGMFSDRATGTEVSKMFVYLLSQSDCSYKWTYQGSSDFAPVIRGAAWSHDEKEAYVLGLDYAVYPSTEYLIVFRQPSSWIYGGKPVIFSTSIRTAAYSEVVNNVVQLYSVRAD